MLLLNIMNNDNNNTQQRTQIHGPASIELSKVSWAGTNSDDAINHAIKENEGGQTITMFLSDFHEGDVVTMNINGDDIITGIP